jgi:ribosomal-protein-alanine N-acetyltransferase
MEIETPRLLIRSLQLADAEAMVAMWADPQVTQFMGGPRDRAEVRRLVEEDAQLPTPREIDLWPVVEKSSGRAVGDCGLINKEVDGEDEVELIYVLERESWGKGYATEAASAIMRYAFVELGLPRLICLIDPRNAASQRVAVKLGMTLEKETVRPGGRVMRVYAISNPWGQTLVPPRAS